MVPAPVSRALVTKIQRMAIQAFQSVDGAGLALPAHLVRFERFADCRHAVIPDAPEQGIALMREFIERR